MKQRHYLLSFFALLLLIFIVIRYGTPSRKENPVTMPCVRYDTVDRYYVDSVTHELMNWKHEPVKYETIEP